MPTPPPLPKPGSEWDWEKKILALCLHGEKTCRSPKPQHGEIWCITSEDCDAKDKPCQCWLFWAKDGDKEWKPFPEPKKKQPYNDDYSYACFCVRILEPGHKG